MRGVFHSFVDLLPITEEVYRILRPGGVFAFTIVPLTVKDAGFNCESIWNILSLHPPGRLPNSNTLTNILMR